MSHGDPLVAIGVGKFGAGDHWWNLSTICSNPVTDKGVAGSVKFSSWVMICRDILHLLRCGLRLRDGRSEFVRGCGA